MRKLILFFAFCSWAYSADSLESQNLQMPALISTAICTDPVILRNAIRERPLEVLYSFTQESERFYDDLRLCAISDDKKAYAVQVLHCMNEHERTCKFFLLGECQCQLGGTQCQLNRSLNPEYRNAFEEKLGELLTAAADITKPIRCVAFASGDLFQELVALTRFLYKNPTASLELYLIDLKYADFTSWLNEQSISARNPRINNKASKTFAYYTHETIDSCLIHGRTIQQFLRCLRFMFPKATINVTVHKSDLAYSAFIKEHDIPAADVLWAADLNDGQSHRTNAQGQFTALGLEALAHKPTARTLLLAMHRESRTNNIIAYLSSLFRMQVAENEWEEAAFTTQIIP